MNNSEQIIAADVKYNAYRATSLPGFKTLYIRRRSQLLRSKKLTEDCKPLPNYLQLRLSLLQQRYNISLDQLSQKSSLTAVRSASRLTMEGDLSSGPSVLKGVSIPSGHGADKETYEGQVVPTYKAEASRAIVGGTSITENYAFSGVHHIFDQHKDSVTMVRFGNNDANLLACSSLDGNLSICSVEQENSRVLHRLQKHTAGVTGFDWSFSNDLLVSSGMDGQLCLWRASDGECLRCVKDPANAQIMACVFHPLNANWIVAGNSTGLVQVLNVSTGIFPQGGTSRIPHAVTALAFDAAGTTLWAGNAQGTIQSFKFALGTGRLKKGRKVVTKEGSAITSISARSWASREAPDPSLLVNCACNKLLIYKILDEDCSLKLKREFYVPHITQPIRSTFSPMMSFRQGACVVSGSEDCSVWFFDAERSSKALINKLHGHGAPVLCVAFTYDEARLATSDASGMVIVWNRQRNNS